MGIEKQGASAVFVWKCLRCGEVVKKGTGIVEPDDPEDDPIKGSRR
ncbi:MAG: hypothetical protein ACXABY_28910 [Candidatus Thorarchaeota archaeon]